MCKNRPMSTKRTVVAALMAALTVAGSALRITMPLEVAGTTSFHLGNIMCALSGILLGPWLGGLAAGLGSAIYDMMNPLYISEAWITFLTKAVYGLVPGLIMLLWKKNWGFWKAAIAAAGGALSYAALYLFKSYYYSGILLSGLTPAAAAISMSTKLPATVFNASIAVIFAPMLAVSIRKALQQNRITLE